MNQIIVLVHGIATMLQGACSALGGRVRSHVATLRHRDDGQAVTEYTLVILVAATVALLLLNWVQGGAIAGFFSTIFDQVTDMFTS